MAKEYIFKKNPSGDYKLVTKEEDIGTSGILILFLFLFLMTAALLIAPFWTALLGFAMNKKKRYWAGIISFLSFSYFLVDINNKWLSGIWFFGWGNDSTFENGILNEELLFYVYIINGLGLLIGLIFAINAFVSKQKY